MLTRRFEQENLHETQRSLAAALACTLTEESCIEGDWIAKNGPESLYTVIRKLVPEVLHATTFFKSKFLIKDLSI